MNSTTLWETRSTAITELMKKQELIHMHALLVEVAEEVTDEHFAREMPEYGAVAARPTSLHRPKADHEAAIQALAAGILETIEVDRPTAVGISH